MSRLVARARRYAPPACRWTRWAARCWPRRSDRRGSTAVRRRRPLPCSVRRRLVLPARTAPTRPAEHRHRTPTRPATDNTSAPLNTRPMSRLNSSAVNCHDSGYVHIDTSASTSPGFRLRVVCHSYKLRPHEWSIRGHLYKHITQRVSIDDLQ